MNTPKKGLTIKAVQPRLPAFRAGLRKGDRIVAVGGEPVADELEFRFFSAQSEARIRYIRNRSPRVVTLLRREGQELGIRFGEPPILKCANKCLFCFIDQMPKGLRRSLYIKDEDYRYSFTNGNYITLSRAPERHLRRIVQLGLSPLYISVHATVPGVRKMLLGNPSARDIMGQLRFLENGGIRFHAQIVVCPGINDGAVLKKTITDLLSLKKGLLSVAVVPVGLTRHRARPLTPVTERDARRLCREVGRINDAHVNADGDKAVFCADELFIKARRAIPGKSYYGTFPQIENGVGLVRLLLDEWKVIKRRFSRRGGIKPPARPGRYLIVTSLSASSYLRAVARELTCILPSIELDVAVVRNLFFGETVTVAGLMTARDTVPTIRLAGPGYQCVFLPDAMFNAGGYTLDGYSPRRIERRVSARVKVVASLDEVMAYVVGYY